MYVQINQPHYAVWTLPLQSRLFKAKCGRRRRAAYVARDHAGKLVKGEETSLRRALAVVNAITCKK
jgi:hypothetical protein